MTKKKIICFIPSDKNNLQFAKMCVNSLRKFHSEEELPLKVYDNTTGDPLFWYRSKPIIAKELIKEYEIVIGMDADQLILGDLSETWQGNFDVAVVNNSNPMEFRTYPYQYRNIHNLSYVNNGFVVMKSEDFINEWYDMCFSALFNGAQMREQDMLNDLVHGNHYKVKRLDEGDSYFGLASKGYAPFMQLVDRKVMLPPNANGEDKWPDKMKQIKIYHWAGGVGAVDKMNYHIIFPEDIVRYIDTLVK